MLSDFKFHHIGIACFDIEKTSAIYLTAGYCKSETRYDPNQNVFICFLSKEGMPTIELLAPKDETSPVAQTLKKSGVTPYHFCYEVEDISDAVVRLRKMKYILFTPVVEACAIENRKVCFLMNKNIGLIELVER